MGVKIFMTGATGSIGGAVLAYLYQVHLEYEYTLFVRNEGRTQPVKSKYPTAKFIYATFDDTELIENAAKAADVVIHTADSSDNLASAAAIAKGLEAGHSADRPGYWIHLSGTGIVTWNDYVNNRSGEGPLADQRYNDVQSVDRLISLPDEAHHRNVDKVVQAANSAAVKTAVVCPPCIYGAYSGPVNQRSVQVPDMARAALQLGFAPIVGVGKTEWDNVHINDLGNLYVKMVDTTQDPSKNDNPEIFGLHGYFFAENGTHCHSRNRIKMTIVAAAASGLTSPLGVVIIAMAAPVLIYLAERHVFSVPYPPGIPLIREPVGARRFSLRTRLAYYVDCESVYREAYENFIKQGNPVIVPGLGFRKEVILPSSSLRWVLSQPDSRLDVGSAFAEMNQVRWSFGSVESVIDPWQGVLVKTELNRVLENVCAAMNDELCQVVDEHFSEQMEAWTEIHLASTMNMIVAQAASRFTVGLPLCRNKDYLRTVLQLNNLLLLNAGIVGGMPTIMQPIVGRLFNLFTRVKVRKLRKWLVPVWKERVENLTRPQTKLKHVEPQDHVQLMVQYASAERPEELGNYDLIMARICGQNFAAIHQTGIQMTNLLLNVIGSDAEFNTVSILRQEVERILGSNGDCGNLRSLKWTKAMVNQLIEADSVCRETLRLHSVGSRVAMRKVMVEGFLTDTGHSLPKGSLISFLSQPVHTDVARLDGPFSYDPFRYSRNNDRKAADNHDDNKSPPVNPVTTSPEFLPFGHGKRACPGRFLIDFEFKMILAYILRNYDLKFPAAYKGQRPPNTWKTEALFPPAGAKVLVRRRSLAN